MALKWELLKTAAGAPVAALGFVDNSLSAVVTVRGAEIGAIAEAGASRRELMLRDPQVRRKLGRIQAAFQPQPATSPLWDDLRENGGITAETRGAPRALASATFRQIYVLRGEEKKVEAAL